MIKNMMMVAALMATPMVLSASAEAKDTEYCREYTKTIIIGGRSERAYGTACYQSDGAWEIVNFKGSHRAQDEIREVIYKDIRKGKHKRGKTVIVENKHHSYAHEKPRYYSAHHQARYYGWPRLNTAFYDKGYHNCKSKHGYHGKGYDRHKGHR
jgi:hypothetical protein